MKKAILSLILLLPLQAFAADTPIQLGIATWSYPVYAGADTRQVMPIPIIRY